MSQVAPPRLRKRTKVVATIGPASERPETIEAMMAAGMNIVRLNMSHGDHADHLRRLELVRRLSRQHERPIAVLADLQGPKIRTGRLRGGGPVELRPGAAITITVAACPEGDAERVGTTYAGLAKDVHAGSVLLVDDGRIRLAVESVSGDDIRCSVVVGGLLRNNKGINLPGTAVSAPSLSDKDKGDLAWAVANEVDYLALSFVRNARDVRNVRHRLAEAGREIPIIAKIEKPEAVENCAEILAEADGIMVARGDLGIEISTQKLPVVQKELILRANRAGKLVITATQMLESMIENPIPTRAETSDVANAIFDGSDAIMLSGETASGKHPVESVAEMMRIAVEAEHSAYMPDITLDKAAPGFDRQAHAVASAAERLADELGAAAVLVFGQTGEGGFARVAYTSKLRPERPVVAMCHDEAAWRRLNLCWGIVPILVPSHEDPQDQLEVGVAECIRLAIVAEDDLVVVVSAQGRTGSIGIKLHRV
jgi:pyruvate kinase